MSQSPMRVHIGRQRRAIWTKGRPRIQISFLSQPKIFGNAKKYNGNYKKQTDLYTIALFFSLITSLFLFYEIVGYKSICLCCLRDFRKGYEFIGTMCLQYTAGTVEGTGNTVSCEHFYFSISSEHDFFVTDRRKLSGERLRQLLSPDDRCRISTGRNTDCSLFRLLLHAFGIHRQKRSDFLDGFIHVFIREDLPVE